MRQAYRISALFIASVFFVLLYAGGSAMAFAVENQKADDPCSSDAILSEMFSYYPVPIGISPDGKRVLERARPVGSNHATLLVLDVGTNRVLRTLTWKESMAHILWRPDGWTISFSQDTATNRRRLFLWNLRDGTTKIVKTPQTSNQPLVLWSPDGTKLAFGQEFKATVIVSADGSNPPVTYGGQYSMFAWSVDSRELALAPDDESHQVFIADALSSQLIRRITLHNVGKVLDVAWQPRADLLILIEAKDGMRYLESYDIAKDDERVMFSEKADLRSPAWLPPGYGFLFQKYQDGIEDLYMSPEIPGGTLRRLVPDGTSNYLGLLAGGKTIAVTHRGQEAMQILKVSLDEPSSQVLASAHLSALGSVAPHRVYVTSFDGKKVPILVWRSPFGRPGSRSVVVRVHANLHGVETPLWQEDVQIYLKHGVDFIGVNYRGTPGYGNAFEGAEDSQGRSRDVLAACDYARTALNIPVDRIVLLGHSDGAKIALGAALIAPRSVGILALVSLPGLPKDWTTYGHPGQEPPHIVLALHGEKDQLLSPERARTLIEKALGLGALSPNSERWRVIPNEDHVLHLDQSWAFVHSTVMHELHLVSCASR